MNMYKKKCKARPTCSCWGLCIVCEMNLAPLSHSLMAIPGLAVQRNNCSSTWAFCGLGLIVICQLAVIACKDMQGEWKED